MKTDENMGTAFWELTQKYENNKIERSIKVIEELFAAHSKPNESTNFLKQIIDWAKIIIKNIDSIDDFGFLLVMGKLNNEFPKKFTKVEEFLKENLERLTIEDLEKKILEMDAEETATTKKPQIADSKESASTSSDESVQYEMAKKNVPINVKELIEKQINEQLFERLLNDIAFREPTKLNLKDQTNLKDTKAMNEFNSKSKEEKLDLNIELKPSLKDVKPQLKEIKIDNKLIDAKDVDRIDSLLLRDFNTTKIEFDHLSKDEQKKTNSKANSSASLKLLNGISKNKSDIKLNNLDIKDVNSSSKTISDLLDTNSLQLSSSPSSANTIKYLNAKTNFLNDQIECLKQTKLDYPNYKSSIQDSDTYIATILKQNTINPLFDASNPNLNLGVKPLDFERLNLGFGLTPPTSQSSSLSSDHSLDSSKIPLIKEEKKKDSSTFLQVKKPEIKGPKKINKFYFDQLPKNVFLKIFLLLENEEFISFSNANGQCFNLINELIRETPIVNHNYSDKPFLQNLFYTNEHINSNIVIADSRILNLGHLDYPDVMNQIRKVITNIFENINIFTNVEHLEIIDPDESTINSNKYSLSLKLTQLKILNILIKTQLKCIIRCATNLFAIKLTSSIDLRLSNPERVTFFDLDVYGKFVNKFPNLIHFHCHDFTSYRNNTLLRPNSSIREIQIVHAFRNNLVSLFKNKKSLKLIKLDIYVQGIKIDETNQAIIMRDLTTFYAEMRIYLKYFKRLNNLAFITSLSVNFDLKCLNKNIIDKMLNLSTLEINFKITDRLRWSQLLRTSKVLQNISICVPTDQLYLNMIAEYCPNCIDLNLLYYRFNTDFNLIFLSNFHYLTNLQITKEVTVTQIKQILHFKQLNHLIDIKFLYNNNLFNININRPINAVKLTYRNFELLINLFDFKRQLNLEINWNWLFNHNNYCNQKLISQTIRL